MEIGFLLKKFISFFVEPFGAFLTIFVVGIYFLYTKREQRAKIFLAVSLFTLLLFSYPPFANFLVQNLENKYSKYDYKKNVKYIHVLGNGHTTDVTQPLSSKISSGGVKRVLEGIIVHKNTPNSKLIFTGNKGDTNTTIAMMNSRLALALGVIKSDMILYGEPVDTKEEALFTKTIVGESPFVLVTSATHMPRAMMLFESLGMHPIAAPTDFHKSEFKGYLRAPSVFYFAISTIAMHEYIGILWTKIRG